MAEFHKHHCKTLQRCKDDIIRIVKFTEVKEKLIAKRIITPDELPNLDNTVNRDPVEYVVNKMLHSTNNHDVYIEFLKVLAEMEQPEYKKLKKRISDEHDKVCNGDQNEFSDAYMTTKSITVASEVTFELRLAKGIIDQQTTLEPIATKIKENAIVGKTFSEFLIYLCNLFLEVVNDKIGNSHKQRMELSDAVIILTCIKDKCCRVYLDQDQDQDVYAALSVLLVRANKIAETIKNLCLPYWNMCAPNKMSILSIFSGIAQVVNGIKDIDCRPFCELIGDIQQLRACVDKIETIFKCLFHSQLALAIAMKAGATICIILGAVLISILAVPATVPLLIAGRALTLQMLVQIGLVIFTRDVISGAVNHSMQDGHLKGQQILMETKTRRTEDSQKT